MSDATKDGEMAGRSSQPRPASDDAEDLLTSIIENLPIMVFVKDAVDLRFVRFNRAIEEMLGYSREQMLGRNDHDLFPPEEAAFFAAKDREVLANKVMVDIPETGITTSSGEKRIIHTRKIPILAADGTPRYLLGITEDITETKRAAATFEALLESAPDAMVIVASDGTIRRVNRQTERLSGYSRDELLGRPVELLVPDGVRAKHQRLLRDFAHNPDARETGIEADARRKDGSAVPVEISLSPIATARDTYVSASLRDLTERHRSSEALREALEAAKRASEAKDEFLSRMSHELRTPLTSVLGFAQILALDELTADQHESVRHILSGGTILLDLINEVLDVSRISSGRLALASEPVAVAETVCEVVSLVQPLAVAAGVTLSAQGDDAVHVLADRQRLKQVLLNLLSNAVKYNRRGGTVEVTWATTGRRLCLAVRDSGIGMDADQMDRLYEPFNRLGAEKLGIEGTGLGLVLSRGLAEAMGGSLGAESTRGAGSIFTVELSLTSAQRGRKARGSRAASVPAAAGGGRPTIVAIEENPAGINLIERLLAQRGGVTLVSAMQGRLGIELAKEHRPAAIILDLHLSDMPGEAVFYELMSIPETRTIPIIITSTDATPDQVARFLAIGARACLVKPFEIERLMATIERLVGSGTGAG